MGQGAGWRVAHGPVGSESIATAIGGVAAAAFVVLTLAHLVKLVTAPQAVRAEFNHLVAGNLFGTFSISLLLLPLFLVHYSLPLARGVWMAGAVTMIAFAWAIVVRWISRPHEIIHVTPTWIVPVVGVLDVPIALPLLQLPGFGVMLFALTIGTSTPCRSLCSAWGA